MDFTVQVIAFLGGALVAGAGSYLLVASKISYIEGRLTSLVQVLDRFQGLADRVRILETTLIKVESELQRANARLGKLCNQQGHLRREK